MWGGAEGERCYNEYMKRWTQIFKALANLKRLEIIKMLSGVVQMNVGEIARSVHVTYKGTSRHLLILRGVGILDYEGRDGHVFYSINRKLPRDLEKALSLFL